MTEDGGGHTKIVPSSFATEFATDDLVRIAVGRLGELAGPDPFSDERVIAALGWPWGGAKRLNHGLRQIGVAVLDRHCYEQGGDEASWRDVQHLVARRLGAVLTEREIERAREQLAAVERRFGITPPPRPLRATGLHRAEAYRVKTVRELMAAEKVGDDTRTRRAEIANLRAQASLAEIQRARGLPFPAAADDLRRIADNLEAGLVAGLPRLQSDLVTRRISREDAANYKPKSCPRTVTELRQSIE